MYGTLAALRAAAAGFAAFALGRTSSAAGGIHNRWIDHGGWSFAQTCKKAVDLGFLSDIQCLALDHVPDRTTRLS